MVEVGCAEEVADFMHERAAWIRHLRERVRPQRIAPGDFRLVFLEFVLRSLRKAFRRRLGRVQRAHHFLQHVGVVVQPVAVNVARVVAFLLHPALGLHEAKRVLAQFRGAGAAVALEADEVCESVVPAIIAGRVRRHVDRGVRREYRPRDALRVFLVVVGDGVGALVRCECRTDGLRRFGHHAVRERYYHQIDLELPALHGDRAHGREVLCGGAPDRWLAAFMRRNVRIRCVLCGFGLLCRHGAELRGGEDGNEAEYGESAKTHVKKYIQDCPFLSTL